eukprot:1377434-Lingulodinium_polyedra.AAC.1
MSGRTWGTARGAGGRGRTECRGGIRAGRCCTPGTWAGPARRGVRHCSPYAWGVHRTATGKDPPL